MPQIDVVSDASVALKWFHEEGEEEAGPSRALLERHRDRKVALVVLDQTAYEIGNALIRGRLRLSADQPDTVLRALAEICPRVSLTDQEFTQAAVLAQRYDLTLYDAAYAAAAQSRGAALATLDQALLASGLGQRPSRILDGLSAGP